MALKNHFSVCVSVSPSDGRCFSWSFHAAGGRQTATGLRAKNRFKIKVSFVTVAPNDVGICVEKLFNCSTEM